MGIFWKPLLVLAAALLSGSSCGNKPDLEAEKQAILLLHNEQRRAHFEKDAALLVSQASSDYRIINRGQVGKPSPEESIQKFQSYFDAVEFVEWDDVTEPVFSFSDDGTMATTIVEKQVILRQKEAGSRVDTSRYAWLAVYRKNEGKWQMDRMASTNR